MPTDKARMRLSVLSVVALVSATGIVVCDESSPPGSLRQKGEARGPDRAVLSLDVHEGLEATLFASEPMLLSPTNIDVDHRGRVWVCEVVNYRAHARANKRPEGDRILILEDLDGDGRADRSKVYYQGRDIDAALGICVLGNRVIVTCAPNVILFTDEDGDDRPDRKEILFTKTGRRQDDHSTHSFVFGPDGRFYWNFGNNGFYVHDRRGNPVLDQDGQRIISREATRRNRELLGIATPYHGGMVFRSQLDGDRVEVLGHNFRNNYEVTIDSFGNLWQTDNDDDGNRGCRINFVMEHGNYGYRDEMTGAGWQRRRVGQHPDVFRRHWHQNDPGVVPNVVQTGAGSPTGITVYEGRLLPEVFWDQPIACDAGPGVVWSVTTEADGAGFRGTTLHLVKGERDKWFRPIDVAVAPDGSLFVSDWYDPVVGWNRQADSGRGRIYRIAPKSHRYRGPELEFVTPAGAARALANPNYCVRAMAWTALSDMGARAEPALERLYKSPRPRLRARALWLLSRLSGRGRHHVEKALRDSDPDLRIVSLRSARLLKMDWIPLVEQLMDDPSPRVLRECAIALRHHRSPRAPSLWARLAARHDGADRWYLEALGIGADGQWDAYLREWLDRVGAEWNTPAGRDILWRSRATRTPTYLASILKDAETDPADIPRFVRALDFQPDTELKESVIRELALRAIGDASIRDIQVACEAFLRLPVGALEKRPRLREALDRAVERARGTEHFPRLVSRFSLARYDSEMIQLALAKPDETTGIESIRALLDAGRTGTIERFIGSEDPRVGVSTVEVLGNSLHRRATALVVAALKDSRLDDEVRAQAVRSLGKSGSGIEAMIELAENGNFPEELLPAAGRAVTGTMNVALRGRAAELFPVPPLKNDEPLPQMTELLVYIGDPENGKKIYTTATCITCHQVGGAGTSFGPDLSGIGNKLSKRGLYEAILDPSSGIATGYEGTSIGLNDGTLLTVFVLGETDDKLNVKVQGGILLDLDKKDIRLRQKQTVSVMPSGLERLLSFDELVDLVEYLTTLRQE